MSVKKVSELTSATAIEANNLLLVITNTETIPESQNITVQDFFANVNVVSANTITVFSSNTPATSNSLNVGQGVVFYDSNYLYVAIANNNVKRVALSSF